MEDSFIDSSLGLYLSAPLVPKFGCNVFLKKDLSDVENSLMVGFDIHDNGTHNMLHMTSVWHTEEKLNIRATGTIHTNIIPITTTKVSLLLTEIPNLIASLDLSYAISENQLISYHVRATRRKEFVTAELITPIHGLSNVSLQGALSPSSTSNSNQYNFSGKLYKNSNIFDVIGVVHMVSELPVGVHLKFQPLSREDVPADLSYGLSKMNGINTVRFTIMQEDQRVIHIGAQLAFFSKLNWKILLVVVPNKLVDPMVDLGISLTPVSTERLSGNFSLITPWKDLGIDHISFRTNVSTSPTNGFIQNAYDVAGIKGHGLYTWTWIPREDMQINLDNTVQRPNQQPRLFEANFKYLNTSVHNIVRKNGGSRLAITLGANLNIDSLWKLESNGTINFIPNDMGVGINVRLPGPAGDLHKLSGRCRGNINMGSNAGEDMDFSYEVKYETEQTRQRYASRGQYRNVTDLQGVVRIEWGHDIKKDAVETNVQMLRKDTRREFSARVATPIYVEDSLMASGAYDIMENYHIFSGRINYPASIQIADTEITFASLSNMKGHVNCTTPFKNVTWLHGDFDFSTTG